MRGISGYDGLCKIRGWCKSKDPNMREGYFFRKDCAGFSKGRSIKQMVRELRGMMGRGRFGDGAKSKATNL